MVGSVADVRPEVPNPDKVIYLTQTTLSLDDTAAIVEALRRKFPKMQFRRRMTSVTPPKIGKTP